MEYHPGGDLLSLLERSPERCVPEKWVVFYLSQTATALNHLHSMGYVHRYCPNKHLFAHSINLGFHNSNAFEFFFQFLQEVSMGDKTI